MPIPDYQALLLPVLRILEDGKEDYRRHSSFAVMGSAQMLWGPIPNRWTPPVSVVVESKCLPRWGQRSLPTTP
jgi:hypothetical protein